MLSPQISDLQSVGIQAGIIGEFNVGSNSLHFQCFKFLQKNDNRPLLLEGLLCARHCAKGFICAVLFDS